MSEFEAFPKMARLFRDCMVTEKIDGTNAQILIEEASCNVTSDPTVGDKCVTMIGDLALYAGSRTRWLLPTRLSDNHGFAHWVKDNAAELVKLGPGRHYGEWWGSGIQRGYGLPNGEKRFSLFNATRWTDPAVRPACCHVVPVLWHGAFSTTAIMFLKQLLTERGSIAAPGFMRPEGIVIWHEASRTLFKSTLEKDEAPKSLDTAAISPPSTVNDDLSVDQANGQQPSA